MTVPQSGSTLYEVSTVAMDVSALTLVFHKVNMQSVDNMHRPLNPSVPTPALYARSVETTQVTPVDTQQ